MSYNDPVVNEAPRAAVGLDKTLLLLQEKFKEIDWLEDRVYIRAYKNSFPDSQGKLKTVPEVYLGNGEYQTLLFNDNLPCSLFFYVKEPEKVLFVKQRDGVNIPFEREVSLIFWCNLQEISPSYKADYPYTEQIKAEFMPVLAKHPLVKQIDEYIDDPIEKVFDEFDLPQGNQLGKYPFAGIRINFKVKYEIPIRKC